MNLPVMDFDEFILKVEEKLREPLPGFRAQIKMSSLTRIHQLANFFQSNDAVQSSVLILLYPKNGGIGMVLTLRKEYKGVHSGQISLPGGKYEDDDDSLIYTALREAKEEIGVNPNLVQVLGQLTPLYIPPSNFVVTPVVGYTVFIPEFIPDPGEVAKIIEITIADLADDRMIKTKKIKLAMGMALKVPCFYINENVIWGATAMILSEFKELIKGIPGSDNITGRNGS
jgi:8-oxo-dGTP pyrophosphatase MutT (NUDIX family)